MQNNDVNAVKVSTEKVKDCCSAGESCGTCMKGGFPMKKEALSFITLLLIAAVTVLGILLINEKRAKLASSDSTANPVAEKAAPVKYEMPTAKDIKATIALPDPKIKGTMSLEEAIQTRRSRRTYSEEPVTLAQLSQVLWAGQGISGENGLRTAPSAKNTYPYTLYVVVRNVQGLEPGLYMYDHVAHTLGDLGLPNAGDLLTSVATQDNAKKSPVVIAMTAAFAKTAVSFPDNPKDATFLEGGHIGQNIYLQVESMKMATVVSAGFNAAKLGETLGLDKNETIIYLIPFGHPGEEVAEEK